MGCASHMAEKKNCLKIQKMDHHHATTSVLTSAGHLKSNECTEFSSAVTRFLVRPAHSKEVISEHSWGLWYGGTLIKQSLLPCSFAIPGPLLWAPCP